MGDSQRQDQPAPLNVPAQRAYDLSRAADLRFLQAWEQGLVSVTGATVRVRQIRRALAALPWAAVPQP